MKTLEQQTLLYDADCPLCRAYTSAFVKTGMLDSNGRQPFSSLSAHDLQYVDVARAANEIALVDRENKKVLYGIDSLLKVLGHSYPWIAKVGNWTPVNWLLRKLYAFISYNRKVIIPNKAVTGSLSCTPDFNYSYRFAFIVFSGLVTAVTLSHFSALLPIPAGTFSRELFLAFVQLAFQGLLLLKKDPQTQVNYFGHLMTVSLMGSLMLAPMLLMTQITDVPVSIALGWFSFTALAMFAEHYRRIKMLELPHLLCYTWIIYRIIVLILILINL